MDHSIYLCLVLHNHQPIGNFDSVFEQAYRDSYLPFLEVFEPFEHLRIALHTSGPLLTWLDRVHPEYIDRVRSLVAEGRIEIVGGPFYEPILTMIPARDRRGQIQRYRDWLQDRFETKVVGMWTPERVWESQLTADIAATDTRYTILDDFHFRAAGLSQDQLTGYFVTEDGGSVLRVFPGSERLRYLIPFAEPEHTLEFARSIAQFAPGSILVFGDDGEKFGTWPETKKHVYQDGWLRRFLQMLTDNRSWLRTATPAELIVSHPPAGKVYLPDCSYREMTEWSLPQARQEALDDVIHRLQSHPHWQQLQSFLRGGFWSNFRVKYREANEMYSRMLEISNRLETARHLPLNDEVLQEIEHHLYRGQCNCPYWHGAFGGIYLPHLRNANYRELLSAENFLDQLSPPARTVDAKVEDFDCDLYNEIKISNSRIAAYLAPAQGGMMYELDIRSICHNLLATIQRRPESYHQKIKTTPASGDDQAKSIHDRVICKQEGLDRFLQYDNYPRKSLLDHVWFPDSSVEEIVSGKARAIGDFIGKPFDARIRRASNRVEVVLCREALVEDRLIDLQKTICLASESDELEFAYNLRGLIPGQRLLLGVEFNFAGMPAGADDRFFYDSQSKRLGQLGSQLAISDESLLGLIDEWLGLEVQWSALLPAQIIAYPVNTISQSEAGAELIHQSVCMIPTWTVHANAHGCWEVAFKMAFRTSRTSRNPQNSQPLTVFQECK